MTKSYSTRGTPTVEQIKNVSADSALNGEVLIYNSTTELWENGSAGGGGGTEIVATDNLRSLTSGTGTPTGTGNILLGINTGSTLTTQNSMVCLGSNAGTIASLTSVYGGDVGSICIGANAGSAGANDRSVIIGYGACSVSPPANNIGSVVIGYDAGKANMNYETVAVGSRSGESNMSFQGVAVGKNAGLLNHGQQAVSVGALAGENNAGNFSVSLGCRASQSGGSYASTIVINATGSNLNPTQANSCIIKPIRNATGVANSLFYDSTSGELTYDATPLRIEATDNLLSLTFPTLSGATDNILLGRDAGTSLTSGDENILIGKNAGGAQITNNNNICIGVNAKSQAGGFGSDNFNIAIGGDSALHHAGTYNVFVGSLSGSGTTTYTGNNIVCVGHGSANQGAKPNLTAVGAYAGRQNAGNNCLYLGNSAADNGGNHNNTIVLNGTGGALNPNGTNRFFVNPIRGVAHGIGVGILKYDPTTAEITYSTS
jgi:hypothetical protein